MSIRTTHQVPCPFCRARVNLPCTNAQGQRLPGVHLQRTAALRRASLEAIKSLYAPLRAARQAR
jgi:hypothetical protein